MFNGGVSSALERAMDGVALRQRVISQNISNAMTPGYSAKKVDFEGALASALSGGQAASDVQLEVTGTGSAARLDGNNVEMERESTELMRSGLQFDALVQAANYHHNVYRAAVRS